MQGSSLRHRVERIGLAIGIVLAVVIAIAVINMVLRSDQGPLEPAPGPTPVPTIGPTAPATQATPEIAFDPVPAPPQGSLQHLLGYAPDRLQDNSLPLSDIAQYANIQAWMAAHDVDLPMNPDDPGWDAWNQQLPALAIPDVFATRGTDEVWLNTYGFGLHQVHQVLAVGNAPDYIIVMRGNFDADALLAAWTESGYQAVRFNGITYWSLNPAGSVDLSAPASRPALGNMNNLVLLEDGTLVATSRSNRLEQTINVINESAPSLGENDNIRTLIRSAIEPEHLVTATLLKGTVLEQLTTGTPAPGTATPVAEIPQVSLLLAGLHMEPEGGQRITMVIVAVYDSALDATMADQRAQTMLRSETSGITGEPFTDRLVPRSMRVVASGGDDYLLLMHLTLVHGPADWLQIVETRDLGFIMWPRIP